LVIAGPDQIGWQKELQALAMRLGVAHRITWTGSLADTLKWGAFSVSEVFVFPSHQENFGIVVAEALACGLPVIVSNKVNIWREVVKHQAGFVDIDTVEGTKSLLRRWAAQTPEEIAALRIRARKCFHDEFDFNQTARKVLANVESLARTTPRYRPSSSVNAANGDQDSAIPYNQL
jgi:glycosyltransferase involved in cell wall biosynthesis